jgi:Zn-dependent M32 family carboxypeptidase
MDVAWALFELRMHADPTRDPNALWTAITSEYLHIIPHAEYSWWAARGQLVDLPGYMVNYAMGAVVAADIRARVTRERGGFAHPATGMYRWLSENLYRWGLQRSTKDVLREFLGRPLSEAALLEDMKRLRPAGG